MRSINKNDTPDKATSRIAFDLDNGGALTNTAFLLFACLLIFYVPVASEGGERLPELPPLESAGESSGSDPGLPEDGNQDDESLELDDLLDLVDEDVGRLTQVEAKRSPTVSSGPADALQTVVSTVERKESTVGKTPAAVFVISNEMIRRSGARSIPEALRMAPGVQVARLDSNKWSVSIRGFNNRFANKLLVQIDGRSVYNPLFGGTFWDVQDVVLEDVERIEVVRGPGGTVWGNNAVNGVINVITKSADKTTGTFVQSGGGTEERGFATVRQGNKVGERSHARTWVKWTDRDSFQNFLPFGSDDWEMIRGGGRIDTRWNDSDTSTLMGEMYSGHSGTRAFSAAPLPFSTALRAFDENVTGGHIMFRHTHITDEDSSWQFQTYFDRTERHFSRQFTAYERNTFAIDFQHRFKPADRHDIVWGVDYHLYDDELTTQPFFVSLNPSSRTYDRVSAFVQDTISLEEDLLSLTIGSKFSHNDFTGGEVQPSIRLLLTPNNDVSAWAAVSRAVRTAVRINEDGRLVLPPTVPGVFPVAQPNRGLQSENLTAYEIGLRHQVTDDFSWDATMFYNNYEELIGLSAPGALIAGPEGIVAPLQFINGGTGESWGFELATTAQLTDSWLVRGHWSFMNLNISGPSTSSGGDAPSHQFYLQSTHDLGQDWELDLIGRFVDSLPAQNVPSYFSADVRLSWRPNDALEVFVVGQNLLDSSHPEFGNDQFAGAIRSEVQRGVYGGFSVRY